ncbi:hypothetical protein cyc_04712 [Cyclospora cayetanensis]|uniref:Uncharacterized protein n=1 Tax=Cyclospora cayetanensis TaxID=88456 RepID=A0A1D3D520_9EIME|nr:hypothetical protein cyc_04712 [Cyclospora cayetanensis]
MRVFLGLFVASLSILRTNADMRENLNTQYKYEVCKGKYLNIAASGDKKSPACWSFSRDDESVDRYRKFQDEIVSRGFQFRGRRKEILEMLMLHAPESLQLNRYKAAIIESAFEDSSIPKEFIEGFSDLVAFLCCVTRQANLHWSEEQKKKWNDMGLDVEAELLKMRFGIADALLVLASGSKIHLALDPEKEHLEVDLGKPVDQCTRVEVRERLLEQQEAIEREILKNLPKSESEEAKSVPHWHTKAVNIPADMKNIIHAAEAGSTIPFGVEAEPSHSEVKVGLTKAHLKLLSGKMVELELKPEAHSFTLELDTPVEKCTLEDIRTQLEKQRGNIQSLLMKATKESTSEEARASQIWEVPEIVLGTNLDSIINAAKEGGVVPFEQLLHAKVFLFLMLIKGPVRSKDKAPFVPVPVGLPAKEGAKVKNRGDGNEQGKELLHDTICNRHPVHIANFTERPTPREKTQRKVPVAAPRQRQQLQSVHEKDCEKYPLSLDLSPSEVREKTLQQIVVLLNASSQESEDVRIGAACLTWAANVDIYERLHMTMKKDWGPLKVIDGAPTAADWLGVKLQTSLDTNVIRGGEGAHKAVKHNTRMCIDAVRIIGIIMSQRRQDNPDAPIVGPGSVLATALNLSFDDDDIFAELTTKFSLARCSREKSAKKANMWSLAPVVLLALITWYSDAVECLLQTKGEQRFMLALLAIPPKTQLKGALSFVTLFNKALSSLKTGSSKPKSTLEQAARNCEQLQLETDIAPLPQTLGDTELQRGATHHHFITKLEGLRIVAQQQQSPNALLEQVAREKFFGPVGYVKSIMTGIIEFVETNSFSLFLMGHKAFVLS